jgi:hypothetical protein
MRIRIRYPGGKEGEKRSRIRLPDYLAPASPSTCCRDKDDGSDSTSCTIAPSCRFPPRVPCIRPCKYLGLKHENGPFVPIFAKYTGKNLQKKSSFRVSFHKKFRLSQENQAIVFTEVNCEKIFIIILCIFFNFFIFLICLSNVKILYFCEKFSEISE